MFKKIFIFSILFLILAFPISAYYNPGEPKGFVNDYVNLLTSEQKTELENKLVQFEKETSNEIAVVIIQNLQEDYIENFAVKLFEDWKIGKENKDNGVLVLISMQEKKLRIEVGYGLEGSLTDAQADWIIDNILIKEFQQENYYLGIDQTIDKIILATQGEFVPAEEKKSKNNFWDSDAIGFFIFLFFFIVNILGHTLRKSKSYWLGGVLGIIIGFLIGIIFFSLFKAFITGGILGILGLIFDYIVSKYPPKSGGKNNFWWIGGSRGGKGGFGGGGFGGFGGGSSGGGGASGGW